MSKSKQYTDNFNNFTEVFQYTDRSIFGTKSFVTYKSDRKITYGQLLSITSKLYNWFETNNFKQNDRVVIVSKDDIAVILLFMACLRYGLTAVILNHESPNEELNTLIDAAKPIACFMDEKFFATLELPNNITELKIAPDTEHVHGGLKQKLLRQSNIDTSSFPGMLSELTEHKSPDDNPISPETVAYILFTSGTTSRPKGVEITQGNLLAQMQTFIRQYGYTQHSNLLNVLPLHHTDGLTQGPVVAFTAGASVHRPLRFKIDRLEELLDIHLYKCSTSHFIAVPSMLQLIDSLGEEFDECFHTDTFKFIISTAGYLDPNLWERFENRFHVKIINVYGLTETVCEALYCGPDDETRKIGTIGKPVDTEARIVGDDGKDVAQGDPGELWLKGPHIMKGYFEMEEETKEVLTDDGWFKTGDLCLVDEEGFYHIVGRKKNLIIVGGINIYPDDVANVLRSMPGVLDAAVWGEDDETWGEIVVAALLPEDGVKLDTNEISENFLKHASVEKLPRAMHVVQEFPRGPAGKVIVRDLQELIANQGQDDSSLTSESDGLEEKVIEIAAHSFKCPVNELSLSSSTDTTKGWNSLAHVEFLLNLEKEFGIKMDPKDILRVRSISDALKIVQTKSEKAA